MNEVNGYTHELSRTPHYLVLSRRRATTLFAQLLKYQREIANLQRTNSTLKTQLEGDRNLTIHALHELALTRKEKEPQLFIRRWLSDHRDPIADASKEARLLTLA